MQGFFTKKSTESKSKMGGKSLSCISCGLYVNSINPRMKPFGNFKKQILNIGSFPTSLDDEKNKQWQGKAGKLILNTYQKYGIDLFEDCLNINAVNCRTVNKKPPTNLQIACCRKRISKIIKEYQPKIIVLFGKHALFSIIGEQWKSNLGELSKWTGFTIPDKDYKAWICPIEHPTNILFLENNERLFWKHNIRKISELIDKPLPRYHKPKIHIINENIHLLKEIKSDMISIDYETTGLKPHAKGHEIVCCSVSPNENEAYVFTIPKDKTKLQPFFDLLTDPTIMKTAHNMKYEQTWTEYIFGVKIQNWAWDTMLAAHTLNNKPGITGLKFQTYTNFGIADYSSEVSPYLQAKDTNSLNKIKELMSTNEGKEKVMRYCAYDTIYQFRLMKLQTKQIDYDFLPF